MSAALASLATAAAASVYGPGGANRLSAVCTDTRALVPGALFVALQGGKFDGHAFVAQAQQRGAGAVVVNRQFIARTVLDPQMTYLAVDDTQRALGDIAHAYRCMAGRKPLVAITGSNGKTTTKELCAAILAQVREPVHKTAGNLNNLIGVPQTLCTWAPEAWCAVVEMGMNAPGEITRLTEIAAPTVGVVTCVGQAHLGGPGLGSLENIAQAKCELYASMAADAVCVVNEDDAHVRQSAPAAMRGRPVVRFGTGQRADVRLLHSHAVAEGTHLELRVCGQPCACILPLLGAHNALNAAAAAAAAVPLGAKPQAIAAGLARAVLPHGRLQVRRAAAARLTVVDDTYNANPDSMRAAFAAVAQAQVGSGDAGRRIAVLGDMLELGRQAAVLHLEVGIAAVRYHFSHILALGEQAAAVVTGANQAGGTAQAFADLDGLLSALHHLLRPGDVLLVKGSRGMKMERVVQAVLQEGGG